ncbi:helix-turn-helix domain-containing protein [Streptomyces sp. NPDC001250]|uniref:helix-turn-helix domain-containing protein n=1 Tax=unclassified Streptomyces TaxID=2593676 RepID=UPI003325A646
MHVEHLLGDASLGLRLLWAEDALLRREISGVTVTDLEDPARFVRPGEVVLSGLVWWSPGGGSGRAERFVSALKDAGAAALLAGEETHGAVPDDLVEACVRHRVPVVGVPAHIMFRSITDTVYLRQWGGLSRHQALPENTRVRLSRLLAQEAGPGAVLDAAFAHLGGAAAYVFTPSGRTVAATAGAAAVPTREAVALVADGAGVTASVDAGGVSAYERWLLYLPDPDGAPPRMLHEVAAVLARCQEAGARRPSAGSRAADELGALLAAPDGREAGTVGAALRRCGLPETGPYQVIVADAEVRAPEARQPGVAEVLLAEGALAEVAGHLVEAGGGAGEGADGGEGVPAVAAAVGRLPDGCAFAVLSGGAADGSTDGCADGWADGWADEVWPLVAGCAPGVALHGGIGVPAAEPEGLGGALAQAHYALTSARTTAPGVSRLVDAGALTTLDALLTGVPADVRDAYSHRVLGPLLESDRPAIAVLLSTLETFLACDGSWARTAQALHLHVNTVHYRVERIERLTGRDLSRLRDRLDLWAALMCR